MSHLVLTSKERSALIEAAKAEIVRELLTTHGEDLGLISQSQAAGLLDCNTKTLESLGVPRVELAPKVIRYRIADLKKFILKKRIS